MKTATAEVVDVEPEEYADHDVVDKPEDDEENVLYLIYTFFFKKKIKLYRTDIDPYFII